MYDVCDWLDDWLGNLGAWVCFDARSFLFGGRYDTTGLDGMVWDGNCFVDIRLICHRSDIVS